MVQSQDPVSDWSVSIDEVSAGVYRVSACHPSGPRVEMEGTDPEELLRRCNLEIRKISTMLREKSSCGAQKVNPGVAEGSDEVGGADSGDKEGAD